MKRSNQAIPQEWAAAETPEEPAAVVAKFRAQLDESRGVARAKWREDWGDLTPLQACRAVVANAHLFKPRAQR